MVIVYLELLVGQYMIRPTEVVSTLNLLVSALGGKQLASKMIPMYN